MALWFRPGYHLTEAEIRYAMDNSTSAHDAARFLHITSGTFRKYAEMYAVDDPNNPGQKISLYKWFLKQRKKRKYYGNRLRIPMDEVFENKHPSYSVKKIKQRLIEDGIFEEKCQICGFNEQRMTDLSVGIVLVFKDGDRKNHSKENMEFVCWNCYYLYYGDVREMRYVNAEKVEFYGKLTEK